MGAPFPLPTLPRLRGRVQGGGAIGRLVSLQAVTMTAVVAMVAIFVLYPIYFLLDASLDVGAADVRPPTAYGFDNFAALLNYQAIMFNTLTVAFAATVMALVAAKDTISVLSMMVSFAATVMALVFGALT